MRIGTRLAVAVRLILFGAGVVACGSSGPGNSAGGGSSSGGTSGGGSGGTSGGGSGGATSCGSGSAEALMQCVDAARLEADVAFIAKPRTPGSAHWQTVQDLCAERFEQYGFLVERQDYGSGVNVIGKRAGAAKPTEQVIVSAHYDHIANCPGADDNASGVAAVLETARVLAESSFERTLVLACWDEEEGGLIGSEAYAQAAAGKSETIVVMTSLEMLGYRSTAPNSQSMPAGFNLLFAEAYSKIEANEFRGDFIAIVSIDAAATTANAMRKRADAGGTPSALLLLDSAQAQSPLLSDLRRSDHASFWAEGYPAIMLTDTSNFRYAQYHCANGDDAPGLLDYGFLSAVTRAQLGAHVDTLGLE